MPQGTPRPSEVAAQAKRIWIPFIESSMPEYPTRSVLYDDSDSIPVTSTSRHGRLRVAVIDGDPVDVALGWYQYEQGDMPSPGQSSRIPVVNMANERRAAGDWESGLMAPEECFARRSNLARALVARWNPDDQPHHPIPPLGGIYSPHVVVFRDGPGLYELWRDFKSLPVISVSPVRRPKLDETGTRYSFAQERELMMGKMRTILRIAAHWGHRDICLSAFGIGTIFRNPAREIARMWKKLLFHEKEFQGFFLNVVFAIERTQEGTTETLVTDFDIFEEEFKPSNIFSTPGCEESSS